MNEPFNNYSVGDINIQVRGRQNPALMIIADAPSMALWNAGEIIPPKHMQLVREFVGGAWDQGVVLISPCTPIPEEIENNERKIGEHLALYREDFLQALNCFAPMAVIVFGKKALRQLAGHPIKITQVRGSFKTYEETDDTPVIATYSPAHVFQRPQERPIMEADLRQVKVLAQNDWQVQGIGDIQGLDYQWCLDLQPWLDNPPAALSIDTETVGLIWYRRKVVLTFQFSTGAGMGRIVPLDIDYFNNEALRGETTRHLPKLTKELLDKLIAQIIRLVGPEFSIPITGQRVKFDLHQLRNYGIKVANWYADALQLAFAVDENMQQKNLDEIARRWVPEMAGYADAFNADPIHEGKTRMDKVPHDKMLMYGCGDVDVSFRGTKTLISEVKKDQRQWNIVQKIQMPVLHAFLEAEEIGIAIDREALRTLGVTLKERWEKENTALLREAARLCPEVCRSHAEKGLKFSRPEFVRDLLFTPKPVGLGLKPVVMTKKSQKLPPEEQLESTSSKDHLPFFDHIPFIGGREGTHDGLIEFQKLTALRQNFVGMESESSWLKLRRTKSGEYGKPIIEAYAAAGYLPPPPKSQPLRRKAGSNGDAVEAEALVIVSEFTTANGKVYGEDAQRNVYVLDQQEAKGYWQYLETVDPDAIHSDFGLDVAVTGRSNSRDPNCQNWSKRGRDAKLFRRIFIARPGWELIESDLSQAELRVAAVMFNEPTMLRIYREGGDIHVYTAQKVLGLNQAQWDALPEIERDEARQQAKAVNFGYIFGMWWRKFRNYAKTNYGVTITDQQAKANRDTFFATYSALEKGHSAVRTFVNKHHYVRALHGALRRLPGITSVDERVRGDCERQAINAPIQRFASDLALIAFSQFSKYADRSKMRPIGFIHDAVIIEARKKYVPQAVSAIKWLMENPPLREWFGLSFPIPILSDQAHGPNLAEMKKLPDAKAIRPRWFPGYN